MATPGYRIGLVGATGQVGKAFLKILEEGPREDLPIAELRLFASERSAAAGVDRRPARRHIAHSPRWNLFGS